MDDKDASLQDRAVAQAVRQGVGVPDKYRPDGQMNCEMCMGFNKVMIVFVSLT